MNLDLPLSPKQMESMRASTARVNLWEGSIRSGKTIASLLRFLIAVAACPGGGQIVVIARTRDTAGRNVFAPLQDATLFGAIAQHVAYTPGAPTASVLGRTVYVIGASDAKAEKVIRGLTVVLAYVDEVTVIPEEFFTQLLGRMSPPGAQLFGTTNPDNPAHWLKRRFLDRIGELPDWRRFHFTLPDNPSLTRDYIDSISREFTGLWHRRFILGEWVAAEGAVYDMWDDTKHVIAWAALPLMRRLLAVGVDYGTTNASAGLLLGLGEDEKLYLLDEWRWDPAHTNIRLSDAQLAAQFRDWLALPNHRPEWIVVDPAAASFRTELFNTGITTQPADNDVAYGIRTTASLLGARQLLVSDRCTGFIQEVTGYSWDDKATKKGEDKPLKVADHSLDAARYALVTTEALWRNELASDLPQAA